MQDFKAFYSIFKSVMIDKAKEEHKPNLDNKASMAAYAKAVGIQGKASFMPVQSDKMVVDYVV